MGNEPTSGTRLRVAEQFAFCSTEEVLFEMGEDFRRHPVRHSLISADDRRETSFHGRSTSSSNFLHRGCAGGFGGMGWRIGLGV